MQPQNRNRIHAATLGCVTAVLFASTNVFAADPSSYNGPGILELRMVAMSDPTTCIFYSMTNGRMFWSGDRFVIPENEKASASVEFTQGANTYVEIFRRTDHLTPVGLVQNSQNLPIDPAVFDETVTHFAVQVGMDTSGRETQDSDYTVTPFSDTDYIYKIAEIAFPDAPHGGVRFSVSGEIQTAGDATPVDGETYELAYDFWCVVDD